MMPDPSSYTFVLVRHSNVKIRPSSDHTNNIFLVRSKPGSAGCINGSRQRQQSTGNRPIYLMKDVKTDTYKYMHCVDQYAMIDINRHPLLQT